MWKRREALTLAPPLSQWPSVHESSVSEKKKSQFITFKTAIELYFQNEPLYIIQDKTGLTRRQIVKLAKRCLELCPDGRIYGYRALIPYTRIYPNNRKAPFGERGQHQRGGMSGALSAVFDRFPDLEIELEKCVTASAKQKKIPVHRLRATELHQIFIQAARSRGVTNNEWPFNTQYLGLRTIQKYMAALIQSNMASSSRNYGTKDAPAHLNVGTGYRSYLYFPDPYDAVEIDAYRIDAHLTVAFQTPEGGETDKLLERLWIIAAVDVASTAILAYAIVYRSEVTSDEVIRVIRDAVTAKWKPKNLTVPLNYPEGGGIPNGVIPEAFGACWNITLLDGALAHLSTVLHERIRKSLGFVISWGASGHFERRPNVERTFKNISEDIFKRLPSTTGANPFNGRAENAEDNAVRHRIRAPEVEEMLDIYMAQHNATPNEGISWRTPLEFIRQFLSVPKGHFLLRPLPHNVIRDVYALSASEKRTVRGSIRDGRRPYIELDGARYSSPILAELGNLIGKQITVEINEEDYRQVKAYLDNGAEIGFLSVQGRWSETPHSRRTRREINRLKHKRVLALSQFENPVLAYLTYLSTANKKSKKSHEISASKVTAAARVAREAEIPLKIHESKDTSISIPSTKSSGSLRRSLIGKPLPNLGVTRNRK